MGAVFAGRAADIGRATPVAVSGVTRSGPTSCARTPNSDVPMPTRAIAQRLRASAWRFEQRFSHRGHSSELISRIVCPIGSPEVSGKQPMEVAVSIAAQIIRIYQAGTESETQQGIAWRDLKSLVEKSP